MKKGLAICSVLLAIIAGAGGIFLFHSSYDPAQKCAKEYMEAFAKGNIKKAYKLSEESLTVPYENYAATLSAVLDLSLADLSDSENKDYDILVSDAQYDYDEEETEPSSAYVVTTIVAEEYGSVDTPLLLVKEDGKWYVANMGSWF